MSSPQHFFARRTRSSVGATRLSAVVLILLGLLRSTVAVPTVAFPFNSQVPPVARVGIPFVFVFSPTTFDPNDAKFQYNVTGGPAWLQFDTANRKLWGTPGSADVGAPEFTITAADANGGSAPMQCTLIVSADPAPESTTNIANSLSQAGSLRGATVLQAHPLKQYEIDFALNDFNGHRKDLSFYATLADHTPLPSWVTFDPSTLHFSATPPKLSSSPQAFDILLIASDVAGFAGLIEAFTIMVSDHTWVFDPREQTLDVPKGSSVTVNMLRNSLKTDQGSMQDSDLDQAAANVPSWLSFDSRTLALSGTSPNGLKSLDIDITAYNHFGDVANLTLHVRFDSLFRGDIGPIQVTPGQNLQYSIDRNSLAQPNEDLTFDFGSASWLSFDALALKLSGTVPSNAITGTLKIKVTATSADRSQSDTMDVQIVIGKSSTTDSSSSLGSTTFVAVATESAAGTVAIAQSSNLSPHKKGIIVASAICPLVGVLLIILLLICLRRHERRKSARPPSKSDISRPIFEDKVEGPLDLERAEIDPPRTPEPAPQLHLGPDFSPNKPTTAPRLVPSTMKRLASRARFNRSGTHSVINEGDAKILNDFDCSTWGYGRNKHGSHNPHESMKIPTAIARSSRDLPIGEIPIIQKPTFARSSSVGRFKERKNGYHRLPGRGHGRNFNTICAHCGSSTGDLGGHGHGRADLDRNACPACRTRDSVAPSQSQSQRQDDHSSDYATTQTGTTSIVSSEEPSGGFPIPPTWKSDSANKVPRLSRFSTLKSSKAAVDRCRSDAGTGAGIAKSDAGTGKSEVCSDVANELPDSRSMYEKRQSYIRTRAMQKSPFFANNRGSVNSRGGSRLSAISDERGGKGHLKPLKGHARTNSQKLLIRNFSASSSLEPNVEPPQRRGREKTKGGRLAMWAEGFPRAISRARSSLASTRFEDASEPEWERRSVSVYSQQQDNDQDRDADADAGSGAEAFSARSSLDEQRYSVGTKMRLNIARPLTQPPMGPLPVPPRSLRRVARPRSHTQPQLFSGGCDSGDVGEYQPHENPTVGEPGVAIAMRRPPLSQSRRRSVGLFKRGKKEYPDLKRGSIIDRPRSSYKSGSEEHGGGIGAGDGKVVGVKGVKQKIVGKARGKGEERELGNEAFL